ncbi:hypothetical protein [Methylobacterium nodulans]|uniref:Uncharacterized protein n=1 Tax=Methylobacterium nodulans (strain LMG 21967 / CNCM I-2342 / ORS 2060) TaxID=460265 RepID=B8IAR9_METNO|nr:hypothetical protein [Methylobacterium nodulans]ACL61114.1 hypothetical protein Mnod_6318 [Methylobacterium nodulans ORS 2060]
MAGDLLSPEDWVFSLRMMRQQTNSAAHRRMNVLLLLDDGWAVARVCEALFIDEGTGNYPRGVLGGALTRRAPVPGAPLLAGSGFH